VSAVDSAAVSQRDPELVVAFVGQILGFSRTLWKWWLQSSGSLLLALMSLAALKCGMLQRLHKWIRHLMSFVLLEKINNRPYQQSLLAQAEAPLEALCVISILCHLAAIIASTALSVAASKAVEHYTSLILNLSTKTCLGCFLLGVVNTLIARSSRGIAKKSDILGAETSRQESQVLAIGQTARVIVILSTIVACLPVFNVDPGTLLSFCGFGGLAISLLSKGVVANLIGSLTVYLTQPFTIGDWIQTVDGEVDGWVQSVGPYHTVVMRWDRRPVYIPNSRFAQVQIINASRMTNRRILMEIPVRFGDLEKIDSILVDIRAFIQNHPALDPEQHRLVHLRNLSQYAAMIWVSCYTTGLNLKDYVTAREDVILNIKNIFFKHGTTFGSILERETRRSDASGLGALKVGDSPDPAEEERRPLEASQKALLAAELQRLKQMQESIWASEKSVKDSEALLQQEQERLDSNEEELAKRREALEEENMGLRKVLEEIDAAEEALNQQEREIEAAASELQQREETLDKSISALRGQSVQGQASAAKEDQLLQMRKEDVEEGDRKIEQQHKILSEEKRVIELQREILKEQQKAEMDSQDSEDLQALKKKLGEEEGVLDEAARMQKIAETAESLGGE